MLEKVFDVSGLAMGEGTVMDISSHDWYARPDWYSDDRCTEEPDLRADSKGRQYTV